ncbi:hypothetical protein M426DRAFT_325699 [Hypoxylon sp. CI-4A]|nr:hypothetical protein M426DRAFT_325699 [Hypoxylon sp. CI-4A]
MDIQSEGAPEPPPYIAGGQNDAEEVLQPGILILNGHFVRAQTFDGTPLYELSRDVRESASGEARLAQLSLHRVVHNMRVNADGTTRASQRNKHIFELKHLPPLLSTGYPYCLDAMSRTAMGNLALKSASFPRSGFKIVKVKPEKEDGFPKGYKARRESLKEGDLVFDVVKKRDHYEWMLTEGNRVAVEDKTEDELHRLVITAPLTRKTMDAMIASWCLRIWRDSIKNNDSGKSIISSMSSGRDLQMRSGREILPKFW